MLRAAREIDATVVTSSFHEFSPRFVRIAYSLIEAVVARFTDKVIFVNDEERIWAAKHAGETTRLMI